MTSLRTLAEVHSAVLAKNRSVPVSITTHPNHPKGKDMQNVVMGLKVLFIFLVAAPSIAYANRYDPDAVYYSDNPLATFLIFIFVIGFAFWFIKNSIETRNKRREEGRSIERDSIETDIIYPLIGYVVSAFAVSVPILFIIKYSIGLAAVQEYWYVVVVFCFCVITYLRQT